MGIKKKNSAAFDSQLKSYNWPLDKFVSTNIRRSNLLSWAIDFPIFRGAL